MNVNWHCYASNPTWSPCDLDWGVDPIAAAAFAIAAPMSAAIVVLGVFVLLTRSKG